MDKHVVGIDIGGTMIKGAVFDARGNMLEKLEKPSMADTTEEKFINNLVLFIESLTAGNSNIAATGIGIAGVLDKQRKILIESPNIPVLRNIHLKDTLEKRIMMPVVIENDANIAALGELWVEKDKNKKDFMLITIGTGIGSGLIINGKLWTGDTGKAAEFGHLIIHPDGNPCACGKKGCK